MAGQRQLEADGSLYIPNPRQHAEQGYGGIEVVQECPPGGCFLSRGEGALDRDLVILDASSVFLGRGLCRYGFQKDGRFLEHQSHAGVGALLEVR